MQISKKQLQQIISEEVEVVSQEQDDVDALLENYAAGYESDEQTVSKEALVDFLDVMEESRIPLAAFQAFMESLPQETIVPLLKEVIDPEQD